MFILAMLLRRVLMLLEVKLITREKGSSVGNARALADHMAGATSPFYAEILRRQAASFSVDDLETLLVNLRWADVKLKSTQLDARCLLEEALLASHVGKTLAAAGY